MPESPLLTVPVEVINFIVGEEVTSPAYYAQHYMHFDWPGGDSGATVGIGYDLGYCTLVEILADWSPYLSPESVAILQEAQGLKGPAAKAWVAANKDRVTIDYKTAVHQFIGIELPKWITRTSSALANCTEIPPESFGALVSLSYNRGVDKYTKDGDRNLEMRAIRAAMGIRAYTMIPDLIRGMKRLWPNTPGLQMRRDREAQLFEKGLAEKSQAVV